RVGGPDPKEPRCKSPRVENGSGEREAERRPAPAQKKRQYGEDDDDADVERRADDGEPFELGVEDGGLAQSSGDHTVMRGAASSTWAKEGPRLSAATTAPSNDQRRSPVRISIGLNARREERFRLSCVRPHTFVNQPSGS